MYAQILIVYIVINFKDILNSINQYQDTSHRVQNNVRICVISAFNTCVLNIGAFEKDTQDVAKILDYTSVSFKTNAKKKITSRLQMEFPPPPSFL